MKNSLSALAKTPHGNLNAVPRAVALLVALQAAASAAGKNKYGATKAG